MALRVVVGYDGSPAAAAAVEAGAKLFPGARGSICYVWGPPFVGEQVRKRLWQRVGNLDELTAAAEREGEREATRIAAMGVTLARAAGWDAEPAVTRTYSAEGTAIVAAAENADADLVLVASRGLGGTEAILGSVSDMVVHYCSRPVLVVPYPLLADEDDALPGGPVVVGWDGSAGARTALAAAKDLFPQRRILAVSVDDDHDRPDGPDPAAGGKIEHLRVARGRGRQAESTARAVVSAADAESAAVVVVGSRGRSAIREIILGSVAMSTLHNSHRPVLVIPSPPEAG